MDNLDPGHVGNAEHLMASLGSGQAGASDAFAPITNTSTALPKAKPDELWEPQLPAPTEPPDAGTIRHPKYGAAVRHWVYRDAAGSPLFAAARFEFTRDDGKPGKQVYPYTFGRRQWTTPAGRRLDETRWHLKRPAVPVPLYGLDRLAARSDAKVLLCEGEKSADAAGRVFPDLVAIAAQGGCQAPEKSDWSAIAGRNVVVWPDADAGGIAFAATAAELMHDAVAAAVRIVPIVPSEWPDGWDLADDLPPGVSVERLRDLLDAAQLPDVDDEPAGDADATSGADNVADLEVERAFRLSDLEFASKKKELAKLCGMTPGDLAGLRQKHFTKIREAGKAKEKAEKAQRAADDKAAKEKAKREFTWKNAQAQAEFRSKPVSEGEGTVWPYGIEERDDGLYYTATSEDEPDVWLCEPIEVLGMARDGEGESWGLWLRWRDADQRIHTWSMPNRLLMARFGGLETELVDRGLRIDTNGQQRLYLHHALGGVQSGARVTL